MLRAPSIADKFLGYVGLLVAAADARFAQSSLPFGEFLAPAVLIGGFALVAGTFGCRAGPMTVARPSSCCQLAQCIQLEMRERTVPSFAQTTQGQRSEGDASQPHDFVPDSREQASNFAVLPVAEPDFQKRAVAFGAHPLHPADMKTALREVEPLFQRGERFGCRPSGNLQGVSPWHLKTRMSQPVRELAIVGQQDQSFAALVEPADSEQPELARREQIECARTTGGIAARAQIAARLVEQKVARRIATDDVAVDTDFLRARVDARPQVANDLSVYADSSVYDVGFAFAARTEPGGGQEPLQTDAGRRGGLGLRRMIFR